MRGCFTRIQRKVKSTKRRSTSVHLNIQDLAVNESKKHFWKTTWNGPAHFLQKESKMFSLGSTYDIMIDSSVVARCVLIVLRGSRLWLKGMSTVCVCVMVLSAVCMQLRCVAVLPPCTPLSVCSFLSFGGFFFFMYITCYFISAVFISVFIIIFMLSFCLCSIVSICFSSFVLVGLASVIVFFF